MSRRSPRTYDHRLEEQIIRAGDPGLFAELNIPRSTAASWIRRGLGELVSLGPDDDGMSVRGSRDASFPREFASFRCGPRQT
jgi:hypothetical protein